MADSSSGTVKWYQLIILSIGILTIVVTLFLWGIDKVVANERLHETYKMETRQQIADIRFAIYERLNGMDVRLARIESLTCELLSKKDGLQRTMPEVQKR